jgi:hypothetical protein
MTLILNGTDNSATTPAVTGTDTDTGLYYPTSNQVAIATSGTQAMLANASQGVQFANAIGVGATTPTTSGAGITFPATQSASSNANTLDDYEEGTWTVTDGSGAGLTLSQSGVNFYTKIGRMVYISFYVTYPTTSNSSNAAINLPFTANTAGSYGYLVGRTQNNISGGPVTWQIGGGGSTATCSMQNNSFPGSITNAQLSASYLLFSGWYTAPD